MTIPVDDARRMRLVPHATQRQITEALRARIRTLEAAARRLRREDDDRAVHDLRVASRRLAATLDLTAPRLGERPWRRARRRVKKLRRALRTARDLEVARSEILVRLASADPATHLALEALVTRLTRRQQRETARLRPLVTRERTASIRRAVERAIAAGPSTPLDPAALEEMVGAHVDSRRAVAIEAVTTASAQPDAPEAWHRARLVLKRWRYAIECAGPLLEPSPGGDDAETTRTAPLEALRAAQEALGRVQDLEVVRDLVRRRVTRVASRGRGVEATALTRFSQALAAEQRAAMGTAYRLGTTLSVGATLGG